MWKYTTDDEVRVLAVSETASQVLAGAGDTLFVIDKQGKLIWKYAADSKIGDVELIGRYIVASSQSTVYLFNTAGDLLWSYRVNGVPKKLVLSYDRSICRRWN